MSSTPPTFRDLSRDDCHALLGAHRMGRIAYTFRDRVGIEPIGYAYEPDRIYIRTAPGSKLTTIKHHPWVAFEIDEVDGPFDWRSVVVRGTALVLDPEGNEHDQAAYEHAVSLLRKAAPEALTEGDPVPFRNVILMIYIDEITGRAASTSP